ncbi:hypothetical protein [Rhodococcus ruber]|uniref:hypothetical protein n=1 Tax=Rhodococcus ruber TaxID=1830 RepID=UPI00315DA8EF
MIAATAPANNAKLVTRNADNLCGIDHLLVSMLCDAGASIGSVAVTRCGSPYLACAPGAPSHHSRR